MVVEYYAATEGLGTLVDSKTWLAHPGTVGRPMIPGLVKVADDAGNDLPPGEIGLVFLQAPAATKFDYYGDSEKTAGAFRGDYFTLGDMGYMDDEGFLYLTDRTANLIISGGVNIYPAEVDAVLLEHPAVGDVATIGVPDEEWGEAVKAVVQPAEGVAGTDELAAELMDFCRQHLAHFKCPRSVDFVAELPREDSGKIFKRKLREQYRTASKPARDAKAEQRRKELNNVVSVTDGSSSSPGRAAASDGSTLWRSPSRAPRSSSTTSVATWTDRISTGPAGEVVDEILPWAARPSPTATTCRTTRARAVSFRPPSTRRDDRRPGQQCRHPPRPHARQHDDRRVGRRDQGAPARRVRRTRHAIEEYWRNRTKAGETDDAGVIDTTSPSGIYGNVGQTDSAPPKRASPPSPIIAAMELERYGVDRQRHRPGRARPDDREPRHGRAVGPEEARENRRAGPRPTSRRSWCGSAAASRPAITGRVFNVMEAAT